VLLDADGYYEACAAAACLTAGGTKVTLATRFFEVGREIPATSRITTLRALAKLGVEFVPRTWPARVDGRTLVLNDCVTGRETAVEDVDALVLAGGNVAQDTLYHALKEHVPEIHRIGDAYMPRRIADAITEGHRVGRTL